LSKARLICLKAANGFERAFEALTIQATGFAVGILTINTSVSWRFTAVVRTPKLRPYVALHFRPIPEHNNKP
jgi:hypothetical protein